MAKTYVICIDGTWNAPGQKDRDPVTGEEAKTQTNVMKTWEALTGCELDIEAPYGTIGALTWGEGAALYLNGVGSTGVKIARTLNGATGTGTSERIRDAYRFLAERYETGDKVFGFGFSRGAFALRSLVGFIEAVGLPSHPSLVKEDELHSLYTRYQMQTEVALTERARKCRFDFVGLWDSVGALSFGETFNNFHKLSPTNVDVVCHALALDEQRSQFRPEFYISNSATPIVEEVWFAGVHTNVGGGYVDPNLSNIAFFWMLRKAKEYGLGLSRLDGVGGWNDERYDVGQRPSYKEFWGGIPILGSIVEKIGSFKIERYILDHHKIHESVIDAEPNGYVPVAKSRSGIAFNTRIEKWGF